MIPRIAHPWHNGDFPYEVFKATRITPSATHHEVLDASLELQMDDRLTAKERPAFDELRTLQSRLAIDFFLYEADFGDPLSVAQNIAADPDSVAFRADSP